MRLFPLHFGNPKPPQRYASDIPPAEQAEFRNAFKRQIQRNRRIVKTWGCIFLANFAVLILAIPIPYPPLVVWSALSFIVCLLMLVFLTPTYVCPACRGSLVFDFGEFCPECGKRTLSRAGWRTDRKCTSCGKTMEWRRGGRFSGGGRRYDVRACTHCGLWLDDRGI
jgi:hypothetical protein